MRANCWYGKKDVRVEQVPDPKILNRRDAIVKISSTAICGSDLHLYNGFMPTMQKGDILGHEFMGEIVETGPDVHDRKVGDRVVVSFPISCGKCFFCQQELYTLCENSNPNAWMAEKMFGHSTCGIYGYSHLTGGFAGGQAEYARVPFADVGTLKIPDGLDDEQVLFLTDIFPTGYMGAEMCDIQPGDTVAVWGCGPVGQFAMASAYLLGAERVIGIDRLPERLKMAREGAKADTINYEEANVYETLMELTGGRGPDACIDAVGLEAHRAGAHGFEYIYDRTKQALGAETDRPIALREAIMACRNGGVVSVIGVYGGFIDKFPMGALLNKGLTLRGAQMHGQRYIPMLLERMERGELVTEYLATHVMPLDDGPRGYAMFKDKQDGNLRSVFRPS
jgi:threonine dehydrogenase-like Zn-dependent dehydrogenase